MEQQTAQSLLDMRFISYATPLALARRWARSGEPRDREQALDLLKGLFARFPHSIEIGQELALVYLEARDERAARSVLENLQLLCRNPNEEVLARCGRVYRDKGDSYVAYPEFSGPPRVRTGGVTDNADEALRYYDLALQEYKKAYQIRFGHYPGVNVATLHLLLTAFETDDAKRASHLDASMAIARRLLARKAEWPSEHDDDVVWHAASAGELHLLLREWQAAEDSYRTAWRHAKCQEFHSHSMLKQVIRILYAHQRLGVGSLGAFGDISQVFPAKEEQAP